MQMVFSERRTKMTTFTLRHYQEEAVSASVSFLRRSKPGNGIVVLPTGCHAAGTKIVMHDLSTKAVENIREGDS